MSDNPRQNAVNAFVSVLNSLKARLNNSSATFEGGFVPKLAFFDVFYPFHTGPRSKFYQVVETWLNLFCNIKCLKTRYTYYIQRVYTHISLKFIFFWLSYASLQLLRATVKQSQKRSSEHKFSSEVTTYFFKGSLPLFWGIKNSVNAFSQVLVGFLLFFKSIFRQISSRMKMGKGRGAIFGTVGFPQQIFHQLAVFDTDVILVIVNRLPAFQRACQLF